MRTLAILTTLLVAVSVAHAYSSFRNRIPNGELVPHPCKPNYLWKGVGHKNVAGGGERNPFGSDFDLAGKTWTTDLCRKDSDGDGKTNGQELGDPNCIWSEGNAPEITVGLSHPGVCEPMNSALCQGRNAWVDCSGGEFQCDSLKDENPADLVNITLRYPQTAVPPTETNYYCMTFDLPSNEDYHMIATQPIIDNEHVMHHILLYGCDDKAPPVSSPQLCGMSEQGCFHIIGLWTVGTFGECFHENIGFRVGANGYKRVLLQFHWNNPLLRNDYTDSSGMILHVTKNKRTHNAGVLMTGQEYLQLPPGQPKIDVDGICTGDMTRLRIKNGPIYFTRAFNHMHYLGRSMSMEHYRNGVKINDLAIDETYSYDSPVVYSFQNPVEFRAGDEIRTRCTFKTTDRSVTVFQGDGTSDEMCFGFLTFYPAENMQLTYCTGWKSLDSLVRYLNFETNNCNTVVFQNMSHPETKQLHTRVLSHCSHLGLCLKECKSVVRDLKARHPCLQGDIGDYLRELARQDTSKLQLALLFSALDSCNTELALENCPVSTQGPINRSVVISPCTTLLLFIVGLLTFFKI